MREAVPEHVPQVVAGHFVARLRRPEVAGLFDEGRDAADVAVKPGFGRGMEGVPHRIDRVGPAVRREKRVRVRAEHVGHFALILNRPCSAFALQRMHAGDDRTIGIFNPDRRRDRIAPAPGFRRRVAPGHAVAFVAEVPRRDRRAAAQFANQITHHADLPPDRRRVGDDVHALESRRHMHAARHPAGHQPDDELDAVRLGYAAQLAEPFDHDLVDAGAPGRRIRQRPLAEPHLDEGLAAARQCLNRLEIRPEREHPRDLNAVFGQQPEVGFDDLRAPVAPHCGPGMAGPVVAADEKFTPGGEDSLRLFCVCHRSTPYMIKDVFLSGLHNIYPSPRRFQSKLIAFSAIPRYFNKWKQDFYRKDTHDTQ
ncbi:MAG: hypothetical protein V8T86_08715 [Victivallis sp.]